MVSKLTGNEVIADLLATSQVIFDPLVLLDLAFEDGFRRFYALACEIFAVSDNTNADHVIVLRDVPKPSFLRHVGNRSRPFVDSWVAFGPFIISPNRHFVKLRVLESPIVSNRGK